MSIFTPKEFEELCKRATRTLDEVDAAAKAIKADAESRKRLQDTLTAEIRAWSRLRARVLGESIVKAESGVDDGAGNSALPD